MAAISWNVPYIHGSKQESEDVLTNSNLDTRFTLYVGETQHVFPPDKFLQACWTNGLETPCSVCEEEFDLSSSSPVRLLSLKHGSGDSDPLTKNLPAPCITNYHLACLKANQVDFVPVSHPWHPSIAEAYALRSYNAMAAKLCYEVPVRTLLAIVNRFGSHYSLWHDYISIPQWQDAFRGTIILPEIFRTFEASSFAILHSGREPPPIVLQSPSLDIINDNHKELQFFFGAHLFTRLWPLIELDRAGEAYIMNNTYEVLKPKFSTFIDALLNAVDECSKTMSHSQRSASKWIFDLPLFIQERQKTKCLGYVFDMIADHGCRSVRDKFIGASELLGLSDYATAMPLDRRDACLWLAERQIMQNDLSPLLLRPSPEEPYERALWLKGHTSIRKNMWCWGVPTHVLCNTSRLQGHSVILSLEMVGHITHHYSWGPQGDGLSNGASIMLKRLLETAGNSTQDFLHRLATVDEYQLFNILTTGESSEDVAISFDFGASNILETTLEYLLSQYTKVKEEHTHTNLEDIYDSVLSLLALSASVPLPNLNQFANLSIQRLCRQLCDTSEFVLILVACPSCRQKSSSRVDLWRAPTSEASLYLVPGLAFQYTAPGGVGLIIDKGRIIGRGRFCAARCSCNRSVSVELI